MFLCSDAAVKIQGAPFHRHHSRCNICGEPLKDFPYVFKTNSNSVTCSTCQQKMMDNSSIGKKAPKTQVNMWLYTYFDLK